MPKLTLDGAAVNPFMLPRPAVITETRTFTDDILPGFAVEVTFTASADFTLSMAIQSKAREYIRTYGAKNAIPIMSGGRPVPVNDELCYFIAAITALEPEPGSFDDWAVISAVSPLAMSQIAVWAEELIGMGAFIKETTGPDGKSAPEIPNDSAAPTEPASELPQPTEEVTPNSSPAMMP